MGGRLEKALRGHEGGRERERLIAKTVAISHLSIPQVIRVACMESENKQRSARYRENSLERDAREPNESCNWENGIISSDSLTITYGIRKRMSQIAVHTIVIKHTVVQNTTSRGTSTYEWKQVALLVCNACPTKSGSNEEATSAHWANASSQVDSKVTNVRETVRGRERREQPMFHKKEVLSPWQRPFSNQTVKVAN